MPSYHGKSRLVSAAFVAWALGQDPTLKIGLISYSAKISQRFSKLARWRVMNPLYQKLFPETRLQMGDVTNEHWATTKGGFVRAVGIGGSLTGIPLDILILDDPYSSWQEAHSPTTRETVWDWFGSVGLTRLSEDGVCIIIHCMTGDTPVLMADGTERPLCDIRPGDRIATYDQGRLSESVVQNHASQGHDKIFRLRMTSGRIVHANERHPFLVEENGQLRWVKLKNLTTDHTIVTLRGSGRSGKAFCAPSKNAESRLSVEECAQDITSGNCGQMDIVPLLTLRKHDASVISNIDTGSQDPRLKPYCSSRTASAPSVNSRPAIMFERTGEESCALITITTPESPEECSATIAISPSATPRQRQPPSQWPNTSDFTTEKIVSIEPAGVAEVFDIQVAETENFIANGLVSHNTRWHPDDLIGRLKDPVRQKELSEDMRWTHVNLEALAPANDPLGREIGEPLAPRLHSKASLENKRAALGSYLWLAIYCGRPKPKGGNYIDVSNIILVETVPENLQWVRFWDLAASEEERNDFTAGVCAALDKQGKIWLRDIVNVQLEWPKARQLILGIAKAEEAYCGTVGIEAVGGFKTSVQNIREAWPPTIRLIEVGVDQDKIVRAIPWMTMAENRAILLLKGKNTQDFLDQVSEFPKGAYLDMIDAVSGSVALLRTLPQVPQHAPAAPMRDYKATVRERRVRTLLG